VASNIESTIHGARLAKRKRELLSEQPLHQDETKANTHPVLIPRAVEGRMRKQFAVIELNVQTEAPTITLTFAVNSP
jgi:hypothetical protein